MAQLKTINEKAFKLYLQNRLPTVERFRSPWSLENTVTCIKLAYECEVENRNRQCKIDEHTLNHIRQLSEWFCNDKQHFGIILCGNCGNGKTTLMNALKNFIDGLCEDKDYHKHHTKMVVDARSVCLTAKRSQEEFRQLSNIQLLFLDDLGIEPAEVLDYGNVLNPAIELLTHRYQEQLFTVVTTNLTPRQIREHYGDRIADRFNEMFTKVIFENETYR